MTSDVKAETITFMTKRTVTIPKGNRRLGEKRLKTMLKKFHYAGDNWQHDSFAITSSA